MDKKKELNCLLYCHFPNALLHNKNLSFAINLFVVYVINKSVFSFFVYSTSFPVVSFILTLSLHLFYLLLVYFLCLILFRPVYHSFANFVVLCSISMYVLTTNLKKVEYHFSMSDSFMKLWLEHDFIDHWNLLW